VVLLVLGGITFQSLKTPDYPSDSPSFSSSIQPNIQRAFLDVWKEYSELHSYGFDVIQNTLSESTMQAQPVFDLSDIFGKNRRYKIDIAMKVLDSDDLYI
ncbi:hypothetical protein, partial [Aliamphritea spongicola]|uniref:hypothetical protein n=1 Tax=Aliamphritea spongicola TaxID=707589 RepID=UPI00196B9EAA